MMREPFTVKFDSKDIRSEYLRNWISLLCNTEVRYKKFIEHFWEDNNLFHSASRYQRYLREEEGRGKDIDIEHIKKAMDNDDFKELNFIFQELFIEPIDPDEINHFVSLVRKDKIELNDFFNMHKKDRDRGFWLTIKKCI